MNQKGNKMPGIIFCILLDIIGYASFVMPGFGEFSDLIWAPLSGLIFYKMYGGKFGLIGGILNFMEEVFPFTDFIPSFTIAWIVKYYLQQKGLSKQIDRSI
jgi:hypothetical protein